MFCRYHAALRRLPQSCCRPATAAARYVSSTRKVTENAATAQEAAGTTPEAPPKRKQGRPKGSKNASKAEPTKPKKTTTTRTRRSAAPVTKVKPTTTTSAPVEDEEHELVRRIKEHMPWKYAGVKTRGKRAPASVYDPNRVHVVSEALCDDALTYMGDSLDRHIGCDLIDLNPGTGLWSQKLHERLQPRKHILMEADAELYDPFLSELTSKPNVEMIPKSGILWKNLTEMLETCLPDQAPFANDGDPPERNDTLLVTANLAQSPSRKLFGFDSLSLMVLYQFVTSIHFSSLFQRYGRVRMLVWINDEEKRRVIPRSLSRRKRFAFQTELSCEWLHEVVSMDNGRADTNYLRDDWMNLESAYQTLKRMKDKGLVMPKGREPFHHLEALKNPGLMGQKLVGERPPLFLRPFKEELEEFRAGIEPSSDLSAEVLEKGRKRGLSLLQRERMEARVGDVYLSLLRQRDHVFESSDDPAALASVAKDHSDEVNSLKKNAFNEWALLRDNYHLFRQAEPVMLWDRRAFEPLVPKASEFFPNSPCALLDLQPKAMNPVFLQHGPSSTRSGDMSDHLLRTWFGHLTHTPTSAMHALWPGFGDCFSDCPSFGDVKRGGSPLEAGWEAQTVRTVREEQWAEVVQAWMDWGFRPEYQLFLGRTLDDPDGYEEEEGGSALTA